MSIEYVLEITPHESDTYVCYEDRLHEALMATAAAWLNENKEHPDQYIGYSWAEDPENSQLISAEIRFN